MDSITVEKACDGGCRCVEIHGVNELLEEDDQGWTLNLTGDELRALHAAIGAHLAKEVGG